MVALSAELDWKKIKEVFTLTMLALPAVLEALKKRSALLVIVALPAVLVCKKFRARLLVIVAPPTVLVSLKTSWSLLVMVAAPAVLAFAKFRACELVMMDAPAVLVSLKPRSRALLMVALPAVLALLKRTVALLAMLALPAMLVLKKSRKPWLLAMVALAAVLLPEKNMVLVFVVLALPAMLLLLNERFELFPTVALPAEPFAKFKLPLLVMLTLPPLTTMPAPTKARTWRPVSKVYAPELKFQLPTAMSSENVKCVLLDAPKIAVSNGTLFWSQLPRVLKSPDAGFDFQLASCAPADIDKATSTGATSRISRGPNRFNQRSRIATAKTSSYAGSDSSGGGKWTSAKMWPAPSPPRAVVYRQQVKPIAAHEA